MTVTGKLSRQKRPHGQGSYYQLTTDGGVDVVVSMSESTKPADDHKVLEPLVGKSVVADGLLQKSTGTLLSFSIKAA